MHPNLYPPPPLPLWWAPHPTTSTPPHIYPTFGTTTLSAPDSSSRDHYLHRCTRTHTHPSPWGLVDCSARDHYLHRCTRPALTRTRPAPEVCLTAAQETTTYIDAPVPASAPYPHTHQPCPWGLPDSSEETTTYIDAPALPSHAPALPLRSAWQQRKRPLPT